MARNDEKKVYDCVQCIYYKGKDSNGQDYCTHYSTVNRDQARWCSYAEHR